MTVNENVNPLQLNLSKELYINTVRHFIGMLSPKSKHLLTLPSEERVGGMFSDLLYELESIEFFHKFSNTTKELLAKKLVFVAQKADEFLLKQGETEHPAQAMYVILSGVITLQHKPTSSNSGPAKIWPEKILRKGQFFGHEDVVYKRPPTIDAQTVGYSELLMVRKEDFHIVQNVMEAYCLRVENYLRASEAIARFEWTDEEYKLLEIYSTLCTYADDAEVYGGTDNNKPYWSYFVVAGECRIVREISRPDLDADDSKTNFSKLGNNFENSKVVRLEFEEAKQGYFFGVGEHFGRNYVIANSTLECLLIPRLLVVIKNKELLQKMANDLMASLPSDQEVLNYHSKLVLESKKKTEMFKELFAHKPERLIDDKDRLA